MLLMFFYYYLQLKKEKYILILWIANLCYIRAYTA